MIAISNFERVDSIYAGLLRRYRNVLYSVSFPYYQRKMKKYIPSDFDLLSELKRVLPCPDRLNITESEKESIVKSADKACNGIYNLLGSGDVVINPIRWNYDYVSGYSWDNRFYLRYDQINLKSDSDIKKPRELCRSHHLLHCGIAYKLTEEAKYADLIINHIDDWIETNPLMQSINWECAMDVAIRAVNWMWALRFIADYKESKKHETRFANSLYAHGWYIYRNLEKNVYNNHNHYLSDLIGLLFLGKLFYKVKEEPPKWYKEAKSELYKEMRYEILPCGMSYERSTNYNRIVLEIFLHSIWLIKSHGEEVPLDIDYRLKSMFYFVLHSIQPNGETPLIGDQDNGRILPFGVESVIDFRYLLSLGALLCDDNSFNIYKTNYNIYCNILFGNESVEKYNSILQQQKKELKSKMCPDAGLFIMKSNKLHVMFCATGKSKYPERNPGTHTHSDLLSVIINYDGEPFLCDSGTFLYSANPKERMRFRSTPMHNTITVDGLSQNELSESSLWDFKRNALPVIIKCKSDDSVDFVEAMHTGYRRLENPVIHKRAMILSKVDDTLKISDILECEGGKSHVFDVHYRFDPAVNVVVVNDNTVQAEVHNKILLLTFASSQKFALKKDKTQISKSYGIVQDSSEIILTVESGDTFNFETIIKSNQ